MTQPTGEMKKYDLKLYVTAMTLLSMRAIANVKGLCEEYLEGQYELEIIDIFQRPSLAKRERIIATPMLKIKRPMAERVFVGDMSQIGKILAELNIKPK
ncbi:MAG: circadian clock KaiB family protein [Nitrospirae bacterium]|nr:circadian clock KaiB family protein [Nitrospirota bacterium]